MCSINLFIRFTTLLILIPLFNVNNIKPQNASDIAISPSKDKIAIVQTRVNYIKMKERNPEPHIGYKLWLIDLKTEGEKVLATFEDGDTGIDDVFWSPNGKLICFQSFSIGGHSPLTTFRTWVVDSSGRALQEIKLPAPYNVLSNNPIGWKNKYLIVQGATEEYSGSKSLKEAPIFLYNCETKEINLINE